MDDWDYHPPSDLDRSFFEKLKDFPRQPHMLVFALRSIIALLLRAWLRIYHRLEIEGRNNLPDDGSYVIVCNHTSHLDTLCLLSIVPLRQVHSTFPAAASDYFFSSVPRSVFSAILVNALPFDRKLKGNQSLAVCSELLQTPGNVLIIFPEGTRATTDRMGRFKPGIAHLLLNTELPVVPCNLQGGLAAWPKETLFPRPRKLRLKIGEARSYAGLKRSAKSVKRICTELQEAVAELGNISL